jgi:hypothetical protein
MDSKLQALQQEITLLAELDHPNIIKSTTHPHFPLGVMITACPCARGAGIWAPSTLTTVHD